MVLEVGVQVLAGEQAGLAVVGARDGHAAALGDVRGQGVGDELLAAVAAADEALGAVVGLVGAQVAALHLQAALVLAVQGLVAAAARVVLQQRSGSSLDSFHHRYALRLLFQVHGPVPAESKAP